MKKYYLKILYPSSNIMEGRENQFYERVIEASFVENRGSSIYFINDNIVIAVYPANYTIIYKIEAM